MKNTLNEYYEKLHPAIGQYKILHWHELKALYSHYFHSHKVYFLGTVHDCKLFEERFDIYSIPYYGEILVTKDIEYIEKKDFESSISISKDTQDEIIVIIAIPDYPADIESYEKVQVVLRLFSIDVPYVIHEFSAGFALGSDSIKSDRRLIEKTMEILADHESRNCFLRTISALNTPFQWNMDIKEQNYGISDTKTKEVSSYKEDSLNADSLNFLSNMEGYLIVCNSMELKKGDPCIKKVIKYPKSVLYLPNYFTRLRAREFFSYQQKSYVLPILDSILWDECGENKISVMKCTGGTPLEYEKEFQNVETVTIDSVSKKLKGNRISAIVLDMDVYYKKALTGARDTIIEYFPVIVVQGFKKISELWNAILWCYEQFHEYDVYLYRYETDSINEGHMIILKPKEKRQK